MYSLLAKLSNRYNFYKNKLEEYSKYYFISDTHFSDTNILTYRNKCKKIKNKFTNVGSMNKLIIKNIIDTIPEDSTLYILGDIGDCSLLTYLTNIKLIFILGNHDNELKILL